jgi:beta-glucosidase
MFGLRREEFGEDFVFGAATSAFQIEGVGDGRGPSIWDTFAATPGNVVDGTDGLVACDHFNRWPEDLDLVRHGGFGAYRFSIAWPRVLPEGKGIPRAAGLAFYDRLIDGMLERGIAPYATLYHWDLPSALEDLGGWRNRDVASWFADYADLIGRRFGDRLAATATLNEPWCSAWLSHVIGKHAPGLRDYRAGARAMHHLMLAHGKGIDALRSAGVKNLGVVLNLEKCEPATASPEDAFAANLWADIFNRFYLGAVYKGAYPVDLVQRLEDFLPTGWEADLPAIGRKLDWCGINYYTRALMRHDPAGGLFPAIKVDGPLEKTDLDWEIYPKGLTDLLVEVARDYTDLPIHVTENGMAEIPGADDSRRVRFYEEHLRAVLAARAAGANVAGYFAWSLLDNFEWAEGYRKRFGIVEVDFATQKRTPRSSYRAFQDLLAPR